MPGIENRCHGDPQEISGVAGDLWNLQAAEEAAQIY
jgi:hypothetical protein